MVTFVPKFVNAACADWHRTMVGAAEAEGIAEADGTRFGAFADAYEIAHPQPPADLADVVAHCEHVREVAGIDHVGLGGDYDGVAVLPRGLEDVATYPALLEALGDRGWSEDDLAKLTCRNILRVMRDVESGARSSSSAADRAWRGSRTSTADRAAPDGIRRPGGQWALGCVAEHSDNDWVVVVCNQ